MATFEPCHRLPADHYRSSISWGINSQHRLLPGHRGSEESAGARILRHVGTSNITRRQLNRFTTNGTMGKGAHRRREKNLSKQRISALIAYNADPPIGTRKRRFIAPIDYQNQKALIKNITDASAGLRIPDYPFCIIFQQQM